MRTAVRTTLFGGALLVLGLLAIMVGILPLHTAIALGERVWPILLFVTAVTVVAELATEAGLFASLAALAARFGRGRAVVLWLFTVALAVVSTIFLSLDTTAVVLTPVVVILARHVGLNPLPFAITTVWLANTGSLLLPVSNLTNLLAQRGLGDPAPLSFAAAMVVPAAICVAVPVVVVFVAFRSSLTARYGVAVTPPVGDRVLFGWSVAVVVALLVALVSGIPVWVSACSAALAMCVIFVARRRPLSFALLPWRPVALVCGLFLFFAAMDSLGLGTVFSWIAGTGTGTGTGDLLRLAGSGLIGANLIDNLPAYLALEPVAQSPARLMSVLIGVNAGALITPWASLATLLWHDRLASLGVAVSWRRYALLGLVVAPLTVAAAVFGQSLTSGW